MPAADRVALTAQGRSTAASPTRRRAAFDGQLLAFAEDLREEGLAVGTSELLDAFQALNHIAWTEQPDFKEALAATLAKSPEDRRVFELVFDRFFFRAAEAEAARQGITEGQAPTRRRRRHQPRRAAPADRGRTQRRLGRRDARSGAPGDRGLRTRRGVGRARRRCPTDPAGARACEPSPSPSFLTTTLAARASRGSSCAGSSSTCAASSNVT